MRWIALVVVVSSFQASRADVVTLRCGAELEGEVVERQDGKLEVRTALGGTVVERAEVVAVVHGPTREERYQDELARTDRADPESLRSLATWCGREGLTDRARRWRSEAARLAGEPEPAPVRRRPKAAPWRPARREPLFVRAPAEPREEPSCAPAPVQQVVVVQVVAPRRGACERRPIRAARRGRPFGPQLRWPD